MAQNFNKIKANPESHMSREQKKTLNNMNREYYHSKYNPGMQIDLSGTIYIINNNGSFIKVN